MTLTVPRLLPTSVVGRHGRPGWVWLAREAMEAGRLGAVDVQELMEDVSRGVNRAVEGVEAKIAVHVCFGNLYGRPLSAVRDYRHLLPVPGDLRAWQMVLEFANRGLDVPERWRDWPRHLELGAGVVDIKAFKAETPAEVAERLRAVLHLVPAERLWLDPDCGFWETPRWVVKRKLAALVQAAEMLRKEIG